MKANESPTYSKNSVIVAAVDDGEVDTGLVNHYYLFRRIAEEGADSWSPPTTSCRVGCRFAGHAGGCRDPGSSDAADEFVAFLLSESAQRYFADETFEFPLIEGIAPHPDLPALGSLNPPEIDLSCSPPCSTAPPILLLRPACCDRRPRGGARSRPGRRLPRSAATAARAADGHPGGCGWRRGWSSSRWRYRWPSWWPMSSSPVRPLGRPVQHPHARTHRPLVVFTAAVTARQPDRRLGGLDHLPDRAWGRRVWTVLVMLPLVIPSYVIALTLISFFGAAVCSPS